VSVVRPSDRGTARCALQARLHLALAVAVCAAAAGCASVSIGLQKDGTYNLESSEQAMDCNRLSNSIWGRLQVLKALPAKAKAERDATAPTAVQAFSRWFGSSNNGLASLEEYDRERAHVRSLHGVLIGKGCPPLDIERELAATDAEISQYR
jgi:hypothetical protein